MINVNYIKIINSVRDAIFYDEMYYHNVVDQSLIFNANYIIDKYIKKNYYATDPEIKICMDESIFKCRANKIEKMKWKYFFD